MSLEKRPQFQHHKREDSIWEAVCPGCFMTVSTQPCEIDLDSDEEKHLCSELILNDLLDYFRSHLVSEIPSSRKSGLRR